MGKERKMGKRRKMGGGESGRERDEVRDVNVGDGLEKGHKRRRKRRAEDQAEIDPIERLHLQEQARGGFSRDLEGRQSACLRCEMGRS